VPLSRRELLRTMPIVAAGGLLSGCGLWGPAATQIQVLRGAVPPQLMGRFRRQLNGTALRVNFSPSLTPSSEFDLLRAWANPGNDNPIANLWPLGRQPELAAIAQIGDAWLTQAIVEGLIAPLDPKAWSAWNQLPTQWQNLVRRDAQGLPSATGQVWAAPYRWGTTAIVYRRDKIAEAFPQGLTDWADLLRPELTGRLAVLDDPREVIGLGLKAIGGSYNQGNPASIAGLKPWLGKFQRQVRLYSSNSYLQPLLTGDVWAAVAWSTDALPLLRQNSKLAMVVPRSGSAIWADLWVRPIQSAQTPMTETANRWINHCWEPEAAAMLTQAGRGTSPIVTGTESWVGAIQERSILVPPPELLAKSEFLLPLDGGAIANYEQLWRAMRRGELG
jgi:putative spermidine/putrescine transport system substrate-binding protein